MADEASVNSYPFEIRDYATGAKGTFCIGQRIVGAPAFIAYWNPTGWSGTGFVFENRALVEAVVRLLESERELQTRRVEEEQS